MALIVIRSILFHAVFYLNCTFWFVATCICLPFPSGMTMAFARAWARSSLFFHRIIIGTRVEFRGLENIPEGPVLVAAKHQSAWETMALLLFFPKATYILKRELLRIPLFGWHLQKAEQIPIDRGNRNEALSAMLNRTKAAVERGRQILIFPEGTRRAVAAPPNYKYGIVRVYSALGLPCLPIAMTSGLAWPRNTFLHYPRPIIVEFLPLIPANLTPQDYFEQMQTVIEDNTNRLLAEAGFPNLQQAEQKIQMGRRAAPNQSNE